MELIAGEKSISQQEYDELSLELNYITVRQEVFGEDHRKRIKEIKNLIGDEGDE